MKHKGEDTCEVSGMLQVLNKHELFPLLTGVSEIEKI